MSNLITLSDFTANAIRDGAFNTSLPELAELELRIENSDWHANQNVLEHSLKCLEGLEAVIKLDYLPSNARDVLTNYLEQTLDSHTRIELLRTATVLHDVGKLIALKHDSAGKTAAPGHGPLSGWVAKPMLAKFALSKVERDFILGLISDHLVVSDLLELAIANDTPNKEVVDILLENRPDSTIELILIAYADWLGCDIADAVRNEFEQRIARAHSCLSLVESALSS